MDGLEMPFYAVLNTSLVFGYGAMYGSSQSIGWSHFILNALGYMFIIFLTSCVGVVAAKQSIGSKSCEKLKLKTESEKVKHGIDLTFGVAGVIIAFAIEWLFILHRIYIPTI